MNNTEEDIIYYQGNFDAYHFDMGKFTNTEEDIGDIDFNLKVKGKGLELSSLETNIDGYIENFNFRGNQLSTIFVDALVKEKQFEGSMHIQDDLIKMKFLGNISFDSINPFFDFEANFANVKLAKLGLIPVDSSASLSTIVRMNFIGASLDDFIGKISIDSTDFSYLNESYSMDSLYILSEFISEEKVQKSISVSSDFINGGIKGDYVLAELLSSTEALIENYINQVEFVEGEYIANTQQDFDFDFTLSNTETLTDLFIPDLKIPDSLIIKGDIDAFQQQLNLNVKTKYLSFKELSYDQPQITLSAKQGHMITNLSIKEFIFKEETRDDSLRLGLDSLQLHFSLHNDSLEFDIDWNNINRLKENKGDIKGFVVFGDQQGFMVNLEKADMIINDSAWFARKGGKFIVDSGDYVFDSLRFYSQHQSVSIFGAISHKPEKDLLVNFKKFNISVFDILTEKQGINLNGFLTGNVQLIDVYNRLNFLADLKLEKFNLNGEDLGRAEIKSTWNADNSIYVNINLEKKGNKGDYKPLYLEGYYYPERNENTIDLDLSMNNLSINFLNPFLDEFVANLEGRATGEISVSGTVKSPDLSGSIDLARTQFRIKYLNTLYSLSGKLYLDNEILGFNHVTIFDTVGNKAELEGGLTHHRLHDFGLDLIVKPQNFVGLNTQKGMNELFYGKAVITGEVLIKGPFDNVFLDIDATSNSGTDIKIPINTTLGVSDNNFIVFVNDRDTISSTTELPYQPQLSSFSLNMDLSLTPEANVEISLPAQLGLIEANGSGDLNMNLSRTGNFRMSGDYRVSKGLFFFKIRNLLNRKFTLNEGGTISWTGDPYNGILGMNAKYELKTSLNSLGLDQDSSYRNRVPVDCLIGLSGPIMNPNIKFRFEFPNATEDVKQYVFSKIDTTNPSEMSQQMLSLLVLNSFSFNSSKAGGNVARSVGGSSMQIVANQLSNWLSQISKDVDIGINYRPGGDLTNEEVEVALSTQLFDERVTVDGNFGYQNIQNNPSTNTSSIVGDINVEVKITKDGRLRLKAFNRTNTVDLMDNTSPYTQGVGIFYRKEFNSLKELFRSKKHREKQQKKDLEKEKENAVKNDDVIEVKE
ncbi:MAG: hypothetical protein GQ527_00215 [Bacteroidales bacterium]|nr:hypothetical protein [Bacteroidales bacterium]